MVQKLSTGFLFLLLLSNSVLFAQLRIIPNSGLIITRFNTIRTDANVVAFQNLPAWYYGLEFNQKFPKLQISALASHGAVGFGSIYTDNDITQHGFAGTTSLFQYSVQFYYKVAGVEWFRKNYNHKKGVKYAVSNPGIKFHLFVFDVLPFVGFNINHLSINKFNRHVLKDDYLYFNEEYTETRMYTKNLVSNTFGYSLNFGCKFQFKNKNKDRFALSICCNLGFKTQFYNRFEHTSYNSAFYDKTAEYSSKGNYYGIIFSYPILMSNKRNRHTKAQ